MSKVKINCFLHRKTHLLALLEFSRMFAFSVYGTFCVSDSTPPGCIFRPYFINSVHHTRTPKIAKNWFQKKSFKLDLPETQRVAQKFASQLASCLRLLFSAKVHVMKNRRFFENRSKITTPPKKITCAHFSKFFDSDLESPK